jgi:hypothetical protein
MGLKKIIKTVLICSLPAIFSVLFGLSFYKHPAVNKNVLADEIASISKTNINNSSCLNFSLYNHGNSRNTSRDCFKSMFKYNFLNCTQVLTYSSVEQQLTFTISVNGEKIADNVCGVDAVNYYSQKDLCRFETLNINLYKYRERLEETSYLSKDCDGFAYVPDYIADSIITKTGRNVYDDLFTSDDNKIYIDVLLSSGYSKRYKIANVFRVEGFNENYCSNLSTIANNDHGNGKKIRQFIGDFFVLYDPTLVDNNCFCINSLITPKKYSIIEYSTLITRFDKESLVDGIFYRITSNGSDTIQSSQSYFQLFYEKYSLEAYQIVLLVLAIALAITFSLLCLGEYGFIGRNNNRNFSIRSIVIFVVPQIAVISIIHLLLVFVKYTPFRLVFSAPFMITMLVASLFVTVLSLIKVKNEYGSFIVIKQD